MHTPIAYHNQKDPKDINLPFVTKGVQMDLGLTRKEYAFTSPFPMQRNPPQIVKWHPGASTQLGHDMHWGLLMCQYRTIEWYIFAGPRFSQYTLKRSLILKAALHVLPRQNRPSTKLNRGPLQKKWQRPKHWTLWDPQASTEQFPHPFISLIKARSSKKPVFTWENVSRWQVSTWL